MQANLGAFDLIRPALHSLSTSPAFSLGVIATLGICLGGLTAVATVADAFLLAKLPFPNADRVDFMYQSSVVPGFESLVWSYPAFRELRALRPGYELMAAFQQQEVTMQGRDGGEKLSGMNVSGEFFDVVGGFPVLGRWIQPGEDVPGKNTVAVISYGLWQRSFGGDAGVLHRRVVLNGKPYEIVGVAGPGFEFKYHNMDVWLPLVARKEIADEWDWSAFNVIGLRKPEMPLATAKAAFATWLAKNVLEHSINNKKHQWKALVLTSREEFRGKVQPTIVTLGIAAFVVVLAACANVAGLMMARYRAKLRDFAIRTALGATTARLVQPVLVEAILLAIASALVGIAIAALITPLIPLLLPAMQDGMAEEEQILLPASYVIGWKSGAVAFAASLMAVLISGLLPALFVSRSDPASVLRDGTAASTGASRGAATLRFSMIAAQTALACLVTTGSVLLAGALDSLARTNVGFDPANVLTLRLLRPGSISFVKADGAVIQFWNQSMDAIRALPAVESVGVINFMPFTTDEMTGVRIIKPSADRTATGNAAHFSITGPDYFKTLRIPVRGREFTVADRLESKRVTIINELAAKAWFGSAEPIGQQLSFGIFDDAKTIFEIVGVARNVDRPSMPHTAQIYWPYAQGPDQPMDIVVRASISPQLLTSSIREAVHRVDPTAAVFQAMSMKDHLSRLIWLPRLASVVGLSFAALVLIIAIAGLAGVTADSIALSRREYGIRLAIGADPAGIVWLAMRSSLAPVAVGLVLGLAGVVPLQKLLQSWLPGIPNDALFWGVSAAMVVLLASAAAAWVPARRLHLLDPSITLRL